MVICRGQYLIRKYFLRTAMMMNGLWMNYPIAEVDGSTVQGTGVIDSPVLGKIAPERLSGGVKTLMLVKFMPEMVFNASTCGNNCAKWLLKIAEHEDRTINLRNIMNFGDEGFTIHIINTDQIVHSMREVLPIAIKYV